MKLWQYSYHQSHEARRRWTSEAESSVSSHQQTSGFRGGLLQAAIPCGFRRPAHRLAIEQPAELWILTNRAAANLFRISGSIAETCNWASSFRYSRPD